MKKILTFLCIFLFINDLAFAQTFLCGIGTQLIKDPYNNKTIVLWTIPDSPAAKSFLPEGAEILKVNEQKTKNLRMDKITSLIQGTEGSQVNLLVKYKGKKTNYVITRARFEVPHDNTDETFNIHWKQVAPAAYENPKYIDSQVAKSLSLFYRVQFINMNNYWMQRKAGFQNGYDACKSYPKNEQNACLMNLVNREINKTATDEQIQLQQQIERQQALQGLSNSLNQINTNNQLYNINNNLRQQNIQLQNINHTLYYHH